MIAAWMIYTLVVTLLLSVAASGVEFLARAVGAPTRFTWAVAMFAALALSGRALVAHESMDRAAPPSVAGGSSTAVITNLVIGSDGVTTAATPTESARIAESFRATENVVRYELRRIAGVNIVALDHWNRARLALWIATSTITLAWLGASLFGLRRIARRLRPAQVDDQSVLVSSDVGPATFGVFRSRIVVPAWVLSFPRAERQIILTHEREHAEAFDPALLYVAAFAVALQPWNLGLWALFARLRLAIETDCDRRVLHVVPDPRRYGELVVAVYQHSIRARAPYLSFVARPCNLEVRIRRMTGRPRLGSWAGGAAVVVATVMGTAAWSAPVPSPSARRLAPVATRASAPVVVAPRDVAGEPRRPEIQQTVPAVVPPAVPAIAPPPATQPMTAQDTTYRPAGMDRPASSCILARRAPGDDRRRQPAPPGACSIDGEVLVFALDSTRVLLAARDTMEASLPTTDYRVFEVDPGVLSRTFSWSTDFGHVLVEGSDVYVASPSPGVSSLVFGLSGSDLAKTHPDALSLTLRQIEVLHRPTVTWEVLRRIPSASRCPMIYVDGQLVPDETPRVRDCFLVDGRRIDLD